MDWKKNTYLFYAIGGLLIGLIAGIITVKNAEEKNEEVEISLKTAAKLGVTALDSVKKVVLK